MRVPWTTRRSNQSILKEINLKYSLERLKLKHQYLGHLISRADSLGKTLMLGKIEAESITNSMDMNLNKFWKAVKDREAWYAAVHGVAKSQICLSD